MQIPSFNKARNVAVPVNVKQLFIVMLDTLDRFARRLAKIFAGPYNLASTRRVVSSR